MAKNRLKVSIGRKLIKSERENQNLGRGYPLENEKNRGETKKK